MQKTLYKSPPYLHKNNILLDMFHTTITVSLLYY